MIQTKKITYLSLSLTALTLLAGCTQTQPVVINANTNTNTVVIPTNTNSNVTNTNAAAVDTSGWHKFNITQFGLSIELPFTADQVKFSEQTCGPESACDYSGYALFGIYTKPNQRGLGFLGSVSKQWSPSRDGEQYEVYDLQINNNNYTIDYGNEGKMTISSNKIIDHFIINDRQIVIFNDDSAEQETEFVHHNYMGVVKLSDDGKYKALAISFDKTEMNKDDFVKIMKSITFTNS